MGRRSKGRLFRRGKAGIWWIQYYVNGKEIKQSLRTVDAVIAQERREELIGDVHPNIRSEVTRKRLVVNALRTAEEVLEEEIEKRRIKLLLADTWGAYLGNSGRPDTGAGTLLDYEGHFRAFRGWYEGRYGNRLFEGVTRGEADRYAGYLRRVLEVAPSTFNKHIGTLKLVYRTLMEDERVSVNPFERIKRMKGVQVSRREFSWSKLCEIVDAAGGELRLLFFIGIYTGQRLGHCCLMRWDEVDFMRNMIITVPPKNARIKPDPLHLPISPDLRAMLDMVPLDCRTDYILPGMAEMYKRNKGGVSKRIQGHLEACGVRTQALESDEERAERRGKRKRATTLYGFHSLRHTFVSMQQLGGTPMAVTQSLVGHYSKSITQKYTHVGDEAQRRAIGVMPSMMGVDRVEMEDRERLKRLADELGIDGVRRLLEVVESIAIQ